jgi:hypothetical protein
VYAEVNLDELYEGCALLPDLDAFLEDRGLTRVETRLWGSQHRDERDGETWFGWGDAVWVRSGFRRSSRWNARRRERRILPAPSSAVAVRSRLAGVWTPATASGSQDGQRAAPFSLSVVL